MINKDIKTHASTFIFKKIASDGENIERNLVEFVTKANRIDKNSVAFDNIKNQVKVRQTTAVLYRLMMLPDVVLCVYDKELSAAFKVFYVKDLRAAKKEPKLFIDVTGLLQFVNGQWVTKEIDKLCAYLLAGICHMTYYKDPNRLLINSSIVSASTLCYTKLLTGVIDNLRPVNFTENKLKIAYIIGVYFLMTVLGKDEKEARKISANAIQVSPRDASAWDFYYTAEDDFVSIDNFITMLANTFKLKGVTTDVIINRWNMLLGKGALYGLELFPAFLSIMAYSYVGAYLNNQKFIEGTCGKVGIELVENVLRVGADVFNKGFRYESGNIRDDIDNLK